MDNLYDQLNKLSRLPNAYEEWTEYRKALTDYIINSTEKSRSALIVGAGESNDLDLARLAVHFSSVTLLDCNTEAMEHALARYGFTTDQIRCIQADLVGIRPDRYRKTANHVMNALRAGKTGSTVEDLFLREVSESYRERTPDRIPEPCRWDHVICCGVHSQLFCMYMRMAGVYARNSLLDLERIEKKLRGYNDDLIPSVDKALILAARHSLVIGAEKERMGVAGGIEGAYQALCDPQLERLPLSNSTELVWTLEMTQGISYKMEIRVYQTD